MRQSAVKCMAIIVSLLLPATTLAAPTTVYKCTSTNTCAVAGHVVLDAGSNNPVVGNEWQFFGVKNGSDSSNYGRSATVQDGEFLTLRIYIDNNANPKRVSASAAQNVKAHIALRKQATSNLPLYSSITYGSSANPHKISDTVQLTGAQPFTLKEVPGSAKLQWADINASNGRTTSIDDSVVASGAKVGRVQPGYQNAVMLTVTVQVHMKSSSTSSTSGQTGGTAAPSSTTTTSPSTFGATGGTPAPAPKPAPSQAPAPAPAPTTTPTTPTSTSTSPTTTTPRIFNVVQTPAVDASSNQSSSASTKPASTSTSSSSSSAGQAQTQTQPTTLPDTGNASATSGTLGLTVILIGLGLYYRSRQSLGQRRRAA